MSNPPQAFDTMSRRVRVDILKREVSSQFLEAGATLNRLLSRANQRSHLPSKVLDANRESLASPEWADAAAALAELDRELEARAPLRHLKDGA